MSDSTGEFHFDFQNKHNADEQPTSAINPAGNATFDTQQTRAFQPTQATQPVQAFNAPQNIEATRVFRPEPTRAAAGSTAHPVTMPPAIHPQENDDNNGQNSGKKPAKWKIAAIVVAVIAVIAIAIGVVKFLGSNSDKTAYASCTSAQSSYKKAIKELKTAATQAKQNTPAAGDVEDANTLTNLNQAISDADSITTDAVCVADKTADELKTNTSKFEDAAKEAKEQKNTIEQALEAVNKSKSAKGADTLKAGLTSAINDAQKTLNDSAGKVADESTRNALQSAISNANNVAGQSNPSQADVNNAKSQLEKAVADVNASISTKQQADADKAAGDTSGKNTTDSNSTDSSNSKSNGNSDSGSTTDSTTTNKDNS